MVGTPRAARTLTGFKVCRSRSALSCRSITLDGSFSTRRLDFFLRLKRSPTPRGRWPAELASASRRQSVRTAENLGRELMRVFAGQKKQGPSTDEGLCRPLAVPQCRPRPAQRPPQSHVAIDPTEEHQRNAGVCIGGRP